MKDKEINVESCNLDFFNDYIENIEYSDYFQDMVKVTIEQNLPDLTNKTIYDIGFGSGFCLKFLINKSFKQYIGLDLNVDMMPFLENFVKKHNSQSKIKFIQGDASQAINPIFEPFDFVISTFCVHADSYEKLLAFSKHFYDATNQKTGTLFLAQFHLDFVWTSERLREQEDKYGYYLSPELKTGEKYSDFSPVEVKLLSPHYKKELILNDYVISQETFIKSLKESGFSNIEILENRTTLGKEALLEFGKLFNLCIYRCTK